MSTTIVKTQPKKTLSEVLRHAARPIVMAFIMLLCYLGGFHNPQPRDVQVAIVTTDNATAEALEKGISAELGNGIHFRQLDDRAQAEELLHNRLIQGALIPAEHHYTLLTATAESATTAQVIATIFQDIAQAQDIVLSVEDVVPVDRDDPVGQNNFFFMIAVTVASYATGIAIGSAGEDHRLRTRFWIALAAGLLIATLFLATANLGFGIFGGHIVSTWLLTLVYSSAILFLCVGLHPLLGGFSTLVYASMFVGLNFTTAGGAFNPELQNAFFRFVHSFWIGGGFVEATRNIAYFPHLPIARYVATLIGWLAVGAASFAVAWAVDKHKRKEPSEHDIDLELEENVALA